MSWGSQADARAIMRRLDDLIARFESHPDPHVRAAVAELIQGIDALHRSALERLAERLRESGGGPALEAAQADPLVRLLLGLYDLAELELGPATEPEWIAAAGAGARSGPDAGTKREGTTTAPPHAGRSSATPAPAAFVPLDRLRVRGGGRAK